MPWGAEAADHIMPQVDGLLHNPDTYVASLASIGALIWAGRRLFETVERSLSEIWPGKVLRGYFTRKLVTFSMMLVAGLLLAGFMLFNALLAAAQSWLQQFLEIPATFLSQARPHFLLAYQFVLSCVAFGLMYKFMPVQHVPTKVALVGAAVAAVLWQAGSPLFTYMIGRFHRQGTIYGGLTGVVIFSLWAFLGAQVLLFGAHFAAAYEHVFVKRRRDEEDDTLIGFSQRRAEREWFGSSGATRPKS